MTHPYVVEEFTAEERAILARYFTNDDRPVFALRNLPEIVKGALFARYSRTGKSLRRLFLDEFYQGEDAFDVGELGAQRAADLYDRIFIEFGDDSVAQLGGAHVAVEQGSNILTKQLEWGRLAAYLEQSTRYVPYDDQPGGRYRWYREPDIMASGHARAYEDAMNRIFDLYRDSIPKAIAGYEERFPKQPDDTAFVYRSTIKAKALDALRGMLPAATVSNTGIYGTGQAFESMLLRMRASELAEVRSTADAMLHELNEVIPVFLQRVDQRERGGVWTDYLRETRARVADVAAEVLAGETAADAPPITLVEFDPDAEEKLVAACLYAVSDLPEAQLRARARAMSDGDRARVIGAYLGDRKNRRHKPGRGFERVVYRFDVLADYGAFRDLQRHRMLTIEWQDLTARHGYQMPEDLQQMGLAGAFREAMEISVAAWEQIAPELPKQAQYAVCMAYNIRFVMQMNAREAMHLIELRSSPQGHPAYRAVAHELHRQIVEVAGHRAIAEAMRFVDHTAVDLERLEAERRAERKRQAARTGNA
ncbi:MAG TPA: FAD-dependent thymidylate synthase [Actinomycetota bacterium]|nr:FAD-dependent thymidylate synthase [Actinomycetota bacterium]